MKRSCEIDFDKEKFDLLISVPSDDNLEINVRRVAIEQISELFQKYERNKTVTIKDEINKLGLKLLNLKFGDFDTKLEKDFYRFRIKIIESLTITGKKDEAVFNIFVNKMLTEKNEDVREMLIHGINSIDPAKVTEILFKYIIDDPSDRVRYRIHWCLRENLGKEYQWSKIAGYFIEEFLVKVFTRKEYDIKSCFIKTLVFGGENHLHEQFLTKLIQDENDDVRIRSEALASIGGIGGEDSIVRLSSIKEKGRIFQNNADEGLNNFSERLSYEKEKLIDIFVRQRTNISQIIIKISTFISGLITLGLTIASLTSSNYTEIQIRNIVSSQLFSHLFSLHWFLVFL